MIRVIFQSSNRICNTIVVVPICGMFNRHGQLFIIENIMTFRTKSPEYKLSQLTNRYLASSTRISDGVKRTGHNCIKLSTVFSGSSLSSLYIGRCQTSLSMTCRQQHTKIFYQTRFTTQQSYLLTRIKTSGYKIYINSVRSPR